MGREGSSMIKKCNALARTAVPIPNNGQTEMSMLIIAKRIVEQGPQTYPSITKAALYQEMMKRAEVTRHANETPEMAFTRNATTDTDGRALFAAFKIARSGDHQPGSANVGSVGARSERRPLPPPNSAHEQLMRKAEELVTKIAKSGTGRRITLETAYERVLTDPANRILAKAALRPASTNGAPTADEDEDGDDGNSPASYDDDGGNTALTGRLSTDADKAGRPASA